MKLPIIEKMMTAKTGKVVQLTPHLSIEFNASSKPDKMAFNRAYEVRTEARFTVNEIADDERALGDLHARAERMAIDEIYGPVAERLRAILHMLWESGPQYEDKISDEIDRLISDLSTR